MEVAALGLKVAGVQDIDSASDALDRFTESGVKAEKSTKKVGDESSKAAPKIKQVDTEAKKSASGMSSMASAAAKAGLALGALAAASALKNYADQWSDMQSKVGAAIGNMDQAAGAMNRLVDLANASYSPLQQTADVYARNVSTFKDLGRSATQAADFTEALNHALVTTATKGQDAEVVINAVSRSLATGKLDALAFDTIVSRSPRVLQAMADELGTTTSGLRAMAVQGKVTSSVIADGLVNSLQQLSAEAGEMPATLGDAFQRIQNNLTEFVGRFDKASGASSALAEGILAFADSMRVAGGYVASFGAMIAPAFSALGSALTFVAQNADIALVALAGFYAPAIISGIASLTVALGVGLVGAIRAVTAAMLANPIGLLVTALSTALYAAWQFSEGFRRFIVDDVGGYVKTASNYIINSFVAAYEDIKFVWNNFGNMLGSAVIGGVNAAIRGINTLIEASISGIDSLIRAVNKIPGVNIDEIGTSANISEIENTYASALAKAAKKRNEKIAEIMGRDTIGGWFSGSEGSEAPSEFGGGRVQQAIAMSEKQTAAMKEAEKAANQNADAITKLGESLYLAGLKGEELAIAQARMSLNEYATPEQIAQVDALASAIYKVQENMKARQKFGEGSEIDKYILGDTSPLSGGAFDDQFARYEAEAEKERERYQGQLERLQEARDLQIETIRSYNELEEIAAQEHADRMAQIDQARSQIMLTTFSDAFGAIAGVLKQSHGEQSGIYRAMFAASKAFAVANATINAYDAISKAWASAPFPANLLAVAATAPQVMQVVGAVSGVGLSGMAHDGIDSVPETGTWLLEKGERVTTADTSARLDATLERVDSQLRSNRGGGIAPSAAPVVNVIEDASKAGKQEVRREQGGGYSVDVFVANILNGGQEADVLESTYALVRQGR